MIAGGGAAGFMAAIVCADCAREARITVLEKSAHVFVGLEYLAQGDRVSARKHFQAARDTQDFNYECYELSGLMLQRLETNPDWPPRQN